jgi:leucyl/phenylalanyl-tRNA--protein transferase
MPVAEFPPLSEADEDGLLAIGGDLHPESLVLAYSQGIFPWPISDDYPLAWFSPDPRGIIFTKDLHISRRLLRYQKSVPLSFKFNTNFNQVIKNCAQVKRKGQISTWITNEIIQGYQDLYSHGLAYSIEAYQEEKLVAGVYGTCINGAFSGESMFTTIDQGSKLCLIKLIEVFKENGIEWLDTQMVSPVVKQLGGVEIPREEFINLLKVAKPIDYGTLFMS